MVYIEPALIQKILGGRPLPFIPGGLSADPRLGRAVQPLLKAVTDTFEPLEEEDALYDLAQTLAVVGGQRSRRQAFDYQAAERAPGVYPCLFYAGYDPRHLVAGQRPGPLEPEP